MKFALSLLVLTVLCGVFASPSLAQNTPRSGGNGRKVKTLIDYKSELSLTDAQVSGITATLKSFQSTVTDQRKKLAQYEGEYSKLLAEHAPLEEVKQKLRQVTDTGFNLRYADVLTSRKVEGILTADQLTRWRALQAKVRSAPK